MAPHLAREADYPAIPRMSLVRLQRRPYQAKHAAQYALATLAFNFRLDRRPDDAAHIGTGFVLVVLEEDILIFIRRYICLIIPEIGKLRIFVDIFFRGRFFQANEFRIGRRRLTRFGSRRFRRWLLLCCWLLRLHFFRFWSRGWSRGWSWSWSWSSFRFCFWFLFDEHCFTNRANDRRFAQIVKFIFAAFTQPLRPAFFLRHEAFPSPINRRLNRRFLAMSRRRCQKLKMRVHNQHMMDIDRHRAKRLNGAGSIGCVMPHRSTPQALTFSSICPHL